MNRIKREYLYAKFFIFICQKRKIKAFPERRAKSAGKSQNLSLIHGRGELRSPAGDRRSPLRIKKLRSKQIISPDRSLSGLVCSAR